MASLNKSTGGWYYLIWFNAKKKPTRITEPLKTTLKKEALILKTQLESDFYKGQHDPWTHKWFERKDLTNDDLLYVALEQYLSFKVQNNAWSDNSRKIYSARLRWYVQQLGSTRTCGSLTGNEINQFIASQGFADATIHSDIIKLRTFLNWMHEMKIIPTKVVIPQVRIQRNLPAYLTTEQITTVVDHMRSDKLSRAKFQNSPGNNSTWHLDAVWFAARTGLRITELMSIKLDDISGDQLLVGGTFTTKSKKQRIIPLMDEALEIAKKYTDPEFRNLDPYLPGSEYLFGRHGTSATKRLSRAFTSSVKKSLKIKRRFHDLRHSFAYWYLTADSEKNTQFRLVALKEILGHSSFETTMIYSKLSTQDLRL